MAKSNNKIMSKLFSLEKNDFIKGGVMFIGSAVVAALIEMLQNGTFDIKTVGNIALVSFLTYILKQISTDENGKIGGVL